MALLALSPGLPLAAQELSVLYGGMRQAGAGHTSYTWQVDYRQDFSRYFAASVTYLNEGHVPDHHRDGTAVAGWGRLPLAQGRATLGLGLGAYYFYDTQPRPTGDTANVHGTALLLSAALTGRLRERWDWQVMLNHVAPNHQMQVDTAAVGLGYWFGPGPGSARDPRGGGAGESFEPGPELTLLGGRSVVNTFLSEEANAGSFEYRRSLLPYLDGTASLVYEGDPRIVRRSGLAAQAWAVNAFFQGRVSVGVGLGPYLYIDRKHAAATGSRRPAALAPLVSLTVARRIAEQWSLRLLFHRVATSYDRDSDVFLLGLGFRTAPH